MNPIASQIKYGIKVSSFTNTWLKDNDKEIYLTHDEGKSLVAESLLDLPRVKFTNK